MNPEPCFQKEASSENPLNSYFKYSDCLKNLICSVFAAVFSQITNVITLGDHKIMWLPSQQYLGQ